MSRHAVRLFVCLICGLCLAALPAFAEEAKGAGDAADCKDSKECAEKKGAEPSKEEPCWTDDWFIFWGAANLWPKLAESEGKIDRLLNKGAGSLFPRWDKPTTFKDWRNDFKLWDAFVGVGRNLNDKTSVSSMVGYSQGIIQNAKVYYPLGMPINFHVNFKRSVYFLTTSVDYYPWGMPKVDPNDTHNVLVRMFRDARPFGELTAGYVHVAREGNNWLTIPNVTRLARYTDVQHDNLFYFSPRVGLEMPINEKNSFNIMVGHLFFTSHSDEYDSTSIYLFHRYKF